MKQQNNNMTGGEAATTDKPVGIAVNARLLYPYVAIPPMTYEEWVESIHRLHASRTLPWCRLTTDTEGELALDLGFALHFAYPASKTLKGAIALTTISECCNTGDTTSASVNQVLRRFQILAFAGGWSHAPSLWAFLKVEEEFDSWITKIRKKHGMKYKRDYIRAILGAELHQSVFPKDTGEGELFFDTRVAMKVAMAEPTIRGQRVRECIEAHAESTINF